jgi:diaminopimelate epimerase
MKFTKMHGIGNDYVYVNCFDERVADPARIARWSPIATSASAATA